MSNKTEIEEKIYFDGNVKSHRAIKKDKPFLSVGMVLPGKYDFGTAKTTEIIRVTSGAIKINGILHYAGAGHCTIAPGDKIEFATEEISSYICRYN